MVISTPKRLAAWILALAALILPAIVAGPLVASAQGGEVSIMLRAWACPDTDPADVWSECDSLVGASYRVEADGVEVAGSPVTTVQETGIGPGALVQVPAGTVTVTLTQLGGAPNGFEPAPGFAPFSANVADLPEVGFGGESTGPGIDFINAPVSDSGAGDEGGAEDEDDSETPTTLPSTGTGAAADARSQLVLASLLAATLVLTGAGVAARRAAR
jgi:hypothetical protein